MWRAIATASRKFGSQVSLTRDSRQRFKFLSLTPATPTTFGVCIVKSKINLTTGAGGGLLFRNFKGFKKIGMKKQCVRCGVHIKDETNKLWCSRCMERVMEELEGKTDREWRYYFRWNLRHKK